MYKLLITEDEFEIRNGLANYFPWAEAGFELAGQAENGKQAMQFIDEHHVDVLLCDIRMPVMSGLEVAEELYRRKSPIKVVFLSGFKDFEYAKSALIYGVRNYIVKPTKYNELMEVFAGIREELDETRRTDPAPEPSDDAGSRAPSASDKVIQAVKDYVEKHYRDATLEGAADTVHMNPYYVSKYFKQKTGENYSDYVIHVKMKKAAELLQDIRYKTYEVSELVGYSNAKNFTRTFKKHYGISPREFKLGKKSAAPAGQPE